MSQVLYQSKPIAHPRSTATTTTTAATTTTINSAPSTTIRPLSSGAIKLASAGTLASSTPSTRPRRAAAIASEATIQAVAAAGKRKSSQSSSNKSNSHPSNKATSQTPNSKIGTLQEIANSSIEQTGSARNKRRLPPTSDPSSQRVMAALPRSKRPRRSGGGVGGATIAEDGPVVASSSIAGNTVSNGIADPEIVTIGDGKAQILRGPNGLVHGVIVLKEPNNGAEGVNGTSYSSEKVGNGSGGSVREMINGQETEVFVVDSTSPPPGPSNGSAIARGKRKAVASPIGGVAVNGSSGASAASTIKKRKKDEVAATAYRSSQANNVPFPSDNYPMPSYRGGYNADTTYQSPNGTKWTDNIAGRYHPQNFNVPIDDSEGHYIIREGALVAGRYSIKNLLGQGTFGKVVRCKDMLRDREVAIKIIRSTQKYTDAAQIEIRVLKALRSHDPGNENKCIHLIDTFTYHNHVCIVSELLGKSVFDFLKENNFFPFPCKDIWLFAKQLLRSVAFLHELGLVHTDLKPENILLVNNDFNIVPVSKRANSRKKRVLKESEIRLIDFGSATFNDEYHSQIVSTRHYRAPEIILQMGWSYPCDAWSIGCILIEFYTGEALFQTHDNLEHLAMMEMVLGPMDDDFRRKAETYKPNYFHGNRLDFPNAATNKQSRKFVKGMKTINETINSGAAYTKHDQRFKHLLKRLLTFDPKERIRVDQALKHPYFELLESEIPP